MAKPIPVHDEPDCQGDGFNNCAYSEPHKHGFACEKTCRECEGDCHPHCPAFWDMEN